MLSFPFLVPDSGQKRKKAEVLTQHELYDKETNPSRLFCSHVSESAARTYVLFESKERMVEKIANRDITTWFAIIEADTPLSMYMDMEMPRPNGYICDFLKNVQKLVRWFISFICAEYTLVSPQLDWYFFDATTDEKYSIHVHCPRLAFQSISQLNQVMKRFFVVINVLSDAFQTRFAPFFYNQDKCILDFSVYNRNRNMRMPHQEKRKGKANYLQPVYPPSLENQTFQDLISIGLPQPIPADALLLGPLQSLGERMYEQTGCADEMQTDESFLENWFRTLLVPSIVFALSPSNSLPFEKAQHECANSSLFQGDQMRRLYTLMRQELQSKLVSFPRISDVCARKREEQGEVAQPDPPVGFFSLL